MHSLKRVFIFKKRFQPITDPFFDGIHPRRLLSDLPPPLRSQVSGPVRRCFRTGYLSPLLRRNTLQRAAGWQLDRRGHRILNISFSLGLATLLLMKMFPTAAVLVIGSAVFGLSVTPVWLAVVSGVASGTVKRPGLPDGHCLCGLADRRRGRACCNKFFHRK